MLQRHLWMAPKGRLQTRCYLVLIRFWQTEIMISEIEKHVFWNSFNTWFIDFILQLSTTWPLDNEEEGTTGDPFRNVIDPTIWPIWFPRRHTIWKLLGLIYICFGFYKGLLLNLRTLNFQIDKINYSKVKFSSLFPPRWGLACRI